MSDGDDLHRTPGGPGTGRRGNLSSAIAGALRRYVEVEASGRATREITVKVATGVGRKQRLSGVLVGERGDSTGRRVRGF